MYLVTGAAGMTGSHITSVFAQSELFLTDLATSEGIEKLDIRNSPEVDTLIRRLSPKMVIHLAAETNVDFCQQDPDHAFRSNYVGTLNLALACRKYDVELAYVSTAGVFDGKSLQKPYDEFDQPNPINFYAKSKLEGERVVQSLVPRHYILRAGWMFGGNNKDKKFVGKIAQQCIDGAPKAKIKAVYDKFGSPTYAADFLSCLRMVTETGRYGTYHLVNQGKASRYDVACEVANYLQVGAEVQAVASTEFVLPAERPDSEHARSWKIELLGLPTMRPWRAALLDYLRIRFPEYSRSESTLGVAAKA